MSPSPPFARWRTWLLSRSAHVDTAADMAADEPPVVQTQLVIGEIPVAIQTHVSCGFRWWYGTFPDHSHCCREWAHETRSEAVLCSRLRVAQGFVMELPDVP